MFKVHLLDFDYHWVVPSSFPKPENVDRLLILKRHGDEMWRDSVRELTDDIPLIPKKIVKLESVRKDNQMLLDKTKERLARIPDYAKDNFVNAWGEYEVDVGETYYEPDEEGNEIELRHFRLRFVEKDNWEECEIVSKDGEHISLLSIAEDIDYVENWHELFLQAYTKINKLIDEEINRLKKETLQK